MPQHQPERPARRPAERQRRVRRDAGEQRPGPRPRNASFASSRGRQQPEHAESRQQQWVPGQAATARATSGEQIAASAPRTGPSAAPGAAHPAQADAPVVSVDRSSRTAVPSSSGWASGTGGWIHSRPCSASGSRRNSGEATPERVDRRADIVGEARAASAPRSGRAAAGRAGGLADQHRAPGPSQHDRRRQPVRAGPDDDGIVHSSGSLPGPAHSRSGFASTPGSSSSPSAGAARVDVRRRQAEREGGGPVQQRLSIRAALRGRSVPVWVAAPHGENARV